MTDDSTKQEDKQAEAAADKAQDSADKAEDAADKADESAQQAKEAASEAKVEKKEDKKADVKVSKKLEDIIGQVEKLTVIELSELVKALETKFGVTASAPMAAVAGTPAEGGGDAGVSEQTTFNVVLTEAGANKISAIKAVREIVPTLGLKEAKDLVDAAPKPVLEGANKDDANEAKAKLEAAGAKVELK